MGTPAGLLAHQGGWDELLYVLAPLVLVAGLLMAANRRAKGLLAEQRAGGGSGARRRGADDADVGDAVDVDVDVDPGPAGGPQR